MNIQDQSNNNNELPALNNIPTFDEAISSSDYTDFVNNYLQPNLKTGEFGLSDYLKGKVIDEPKGKENRDITKKHKKGLTHHDDLAKDNKKMGRKISANGKTIDTHDAAVEVAKKHSTKVVQKVVGQKEWESGN